MNILHIGLMCNGRGEGLAEAFIKIAQDYKEFPVDENIGNNLNSLYDTGWKPDLIFQQIHDETVGNRRNVTNLMSHSVDRWRNSGAKSIIWCGDVRNHTPKWMERHCADVVALSNYRDIRQINGAKYLQIGIDPKTFKNWGPGQGHDVVFMGNHYGQQFPMGHFRMSMVNWIKSNGWAVYGNYPNSIRSLNANPSDPFPQQSEESKIYSASKVAISVSHYEIQGYTSDRLFRCVGSNCFTLAKYYPGIEDEFTIGKHLDTFRDMRELKDKVRYYLQNEEEREQIAEEGYKHVQENFTYDSMVKNILRLCEF